MDNTSGAPVKRLPHLSVREFFTRYHESLDLKLVGSECGYDRKIICPDLNRPGLGLAGYFDYFAEERIQVIGNAERSYLDSLPQEEARARFRGLCQRAVPTVILARAHSLPLEFMRDAEELGLTIFQTSMPSMQFLNAATIKLQYAFAPTTMEHGCFVDIKGIGVLIRGGSGAGKSETVLGLLDRGASLVADDIVHFRWFEASGELLATSPDLSRSHMEVRGLGLINVAALFGIGAVRLEKAANVVITLKPAEDLASAERLGLDPSKYRILGVDLPHLEMPVAPGRDMAKLIEVAALNTKLRVFGVNTVVEFNKRLLEKMREHTDDL